MAHGWPVGAMMARCACGMTATGTLLQQLPGHQGVSLKCGLEPRWDAAGQCGWEAEAAENCGVGGAERGVRAGLCRAARPWFQL